jgi:ATP-dependent Clp protease ATP-binding subunit ClpA
MASINQRHTAQRITNSIVHHGHAILDQVQIDSPLYNKRMITLCFIRQEGSYYTFVEPALRYFGENKAIIATFGARVQKGWRQLFIPASSDLNSILAFIDGIFGLDGGEPRVTWNTRDILELTLNTRVVQDNNKNEQLEKKQDRITIGEDLVTLAEKGKLEEPIGRDSIIDSVIQVVSKSKKNSCILIGEPGVGKTAIVEGLAVRIHKGEVPVSMLEKRIYSINMGYIAADSTYYNQLLTHIKTIVDEAKRDERIILFVDEAHMLIDPKHDVSQILKTNLGRNLRVIAATTNKEYHQHIAPDEAFARRFQRIPVPEMDLEVCLQVLQNAKANYEKHHGVNIPDELLPWIIKVSVRYVKDRVLPDKALDLLDEASARLRLTESIMDSFSSEGTTNLEERIQRAITRGDYKEARRLYNVKHNIVPIDK